MYRHHPDLPPRRSAGRNDPGAGHGTSASTWDYDGTGRLKALTHNLADGPNGARHFLKANHQGSIAAVADNNGNATAINSYDPWGVPGATNQGRFQYTGQVWLGELGLYYYKARIYSPLLGRFLQVDPIGYDDQINLYAHVRNDPMDLNDSNGAQATPLPGCMACHSGSVPTLTPQAPQLPTTPAPNAGERTWYQKLGTAICQHSFICCALTYKDAPEVDSTGKVHGDLPDADDIHPDDYDDAIAALDKSIETRARENERFPDGKKNGTPAERQQFETKQRHRERQAGEQRLRGRLAKKRDDHK